MSEFDPREHYRKNVELFEEFKEKRQAYLRAYRIFTKEVYNIVNDIRSKNVNFIAHKPHIIYTHFIKRDSKNTEPDENSSLIVTHNSALQIYVLFKSLGAVVKEESYEPEWFDEDGELVRRIVCKFFDFVTEREKFRLDYKFPERDEEE